MRYLLILTMTSAALALTGSFKPALYVTEDSWTGTLATRIMERGTLGPFRFEGAWSVSPSTGDPPESIPGSGYTNYRLADFDPDIVQEENFSLLHNLDRLNIQARPGKFRITAGRQAIYWGVSRSVSPTDFIAPFPWGTLDTEYRVGVDAVRITYPVGVLSELETGMVFGEDARWSRSSLWFRDRFYLLETDVTLLGAKVRKTAMAGGSLNRALLGASVWVEGSVTRPEDGGSWHTVTAGLERSFFGNDLYVYAEYLRNGGNMAAALSEGAMYLTGSDYGSLGATWLATPLLGISAAGLVNLNDGSSRLTVDGEYSLSDNSMLNAGVSTGTGDEFWEIPVTFSGRYSLYFRTR